MCLSITDTLRKKCYNSSCIWVLFSKMIRRDKKKTVWWGLLHSHPSICYVCHHQVYPKTLRLDSHEGTVVKDCKSISTSQETHSDTRKPFQHVQKTSWAGFKPKTFLSHNHHTCFWHHQVSNNQVSKMYNASMVNTALFFTLTCMLIHHSTRINPWRWYVPYNWN